MAKKTLLTKSAKGIKGGDAANPCVRNILSEISASIFGEITEEYLIEAAAFFGNKCPYTNRDISAEIKSKDKTNLVLDHIVPTNKDHVGLNIKGNIFLVDKKANAKKSSKSVEEFLLHDTDVLGSISIKERQDRLNKIYEFQEKYGYDQSEITKAINKDIMDHYNEILRLQKEVANKLILRVKYEPAIVFPKFVTFLSTVVNGSSITIYSRCVKRLIKNKVCDMEDLFDQTSLDALIKEIDDKTSPKHISDSGNTRSALKWFDKFKDTI